MTEVSERLRAIRECRHLSRAALAQACGRNRVTERQIARIESGTTKTPRQNTVNARADGLQVEVGELTGDLPFPEYVRSGSRPMEVGDTFPVGGRFRPELRLAFDLIRYRYGWNAGPIGWTLSAAWLLADLAGPAYRITVPAVIMVAYLRAESVKRGVEEKKRRKKEKKRLKKRLKKLEKKSTKKSTTLPERAETRRHSSSRPPSDSSARTGRYPHLPVRRPPRLPMQTHPPPHLPTDVPFVPNDLKLDPATAAPSGLTTGNAITAAYSPRRVP